MTKTDKYKFNLIDKTDDFSPDALNANAQAVETELARVEAVADAGSGAVKSELTAALAQQKSEWQAADAALAQADAAIRAEFAAADSSVKSELQASISGIQTAMGSGGSTARVYTGSYAGTGATSYTRTLTFPFKPAIVFIGGASDEGSAAWPSVMIYGCNKAHGDQKQSMFTVKWTSTSVSWSYSGEAASNFNNASGVTYYYVALGT